MPNTMRTTRVRSSSYTAGRPGRLRTAVRDLTLFNSSCSFVESAKFDFAWFTVASKIGISLEAYEVVRRSYFASVWSSK